MKCRHCGAKMSYDSKKREYKCEYCGNEISLKEFQKETGDKDCNKKIAKGILIAYIIIFLIVFAIGGFIFIKVFSFVFSDNHVSNVQSKIDKGINKVEALQFNGFLEMYNGTQRGSAISRALDEVVLSNKKNPNHQITVVYGDISTNNPDEIISMKSNFEEWTKYEVILNYDSAGYINRVTIQDK